MVSRRSKPDCDGSTSQSCGMSCISREDTCRGSVTPSIASRLISLARTKISFKSKSKQEPASSGPKLPEGVKMITKRASSGELVDQYSFYSGKNVKISLYSVDYYKALAQGFDTGGEVGFTVGGNGQYSAAKMPPREAAKIALKLAAIIKFDASKKPDGYKYYANAHEGDGDEYKRSQGFMRLGFSIPVNGIPGNAQYAEVVGGKLKPDYDRVGDLHTDSLIEVLNRVQDNKKRRQKAKLAS